MRPVLRKMNSIIKDSDQLTEYHRKWGEEVLKNRPSQRDAKWTESKAIGDEDFVMETKAKLGAKAIGRRGMRNIKEYGFRKSQNAYSRVFDPEKCNLNLKNVHLWHVS